jgi:hypothetical protein
MASLPAFSVAEREGASLAFFLLLIGLTFVL